ncbi:helix-turn-helix domain-containing protein [Vaginisenegalia massiliensis]|uniref:helix-turn-helix domain-containing protein n=1 Tax=Vaginisenegalia massiliensis TaxID=2058294 RepID=UPI0013DD9908|nr:helix-turn-helix domain-containing protein [Vaginisenegalia massiliensis]
MRYSYEFKSLCVEMYYEGKYPETPIGLTDKEFHRQVRKWVRLVDANGLDSLKHKRTNKRWTIDEKLFLINQVLAGNSYSSVAIFAGINSGLLYQWVRNYKIKGYTGLKNSKQGRPPKEPHMMKKQNTTPLTESEREELIRLRAEVDYIKAENAVIKKEMALRHEKWAAQLKAKKQRSSKNYIKKDTN